MTIMCGLDTYLCLAAMTTVHNIAIVACVWEHKHTQSNYLYVANNMVFIYQTTYSWPLYMINTWLYVQLGFHVFEASFAYECNACSLTYIMDIARQLRCCCLTVQLAMQLYICLTICSFNMHDYILVSTVYSYTKIYIQLDSYSQSQHYKQQQNYNRLVTLLQAS